MSNIDKLKAIRAAVINIWREHYFTFDPGTKVNDLEPSDVPSQDNGHDKAQSQPDPNQNIEQLDALFDLIDQKIPDHHLKPKFIADCEESILALISQQVTEARIDELKRLEQDIVASYNHPPVFYSFLKDRLKQLLKQTPPTSNGDRTAEAYRDMRREMGDDSGGLERSSDE